ncbi:MAG: helix-turn-helix domain-containing protein [Rhodospirillaceae bacterium]|nr:helix-turn-helix domain-containing protein [Rhodospirillaceae bacterium]MBT5455929.1 helix-turn-helix domain-containing protein [Rhodospirillaceae bacterium]
MREVQSLEALFGGQADNVGAAAPVAEPFLSIAEAARALRISPTTLRRYIRDYSAHIDAVRDSRKLMVAVSSIPALAQIRDLRARKLQKPEIDNILAALPGEISLSGLSATEPPSDTTTDKGIESALRELRSDVNKMKRESRDSEVVVRQSLANILFLIERCNREIQYHVSEERIASKERDLRLAHYEQEIQLLSDDRTRIGGWRLAIAALYRRMMGLAFSR